MKNVAYEKVGLSEQTEYTSPQRWEPLTSDFRINAFGIHEVMPPITVQRPDGTGDWLFMLFHDAGRVVLSDETMDISSGTLVCWSHGAGHHYGQEEISHWDHTWIHFDGAWAGDKLKECGIRTNTTLKLEHPESMETNLWRLHAELTRHRQPDQIILKNIFHNWLRELMRDRREGASLYIPEKIRAVKQYLDQHACRPTTLQLLAEKSGMSASHLSAGVPPFLITIRPFHYLIRPPAENGPGDLLLGFRP